MGGTTKLLSDGLASFRVSCKRKWAALQGRVVKPVRALFGRQRGALDAPSIASAASGHREHESEVVKVSTALVDRCGVGECPSPAKRRRLLENSTESTDSADVPVGTPTQNMPRAHFQHSPLEVGTVVAARPAFPCSHTCNSEGAALL
jgi:hypothetical protein